MSRCWLQFFEAYNRRAVIYFILDIIELAAAAPGFASGNNDDNANISSYCSSPTLPGWLNILIETLERDDIIPMCFILTWSMSVQQQQQPPKGIFDLLVEIFKKNDAALKLKTCIIWRAVTNSKVFLSPALTRRHPDHIEYYFNQIYSARSAGGSSVNQIVADKRHLLRLKIEEDETRKLNELYDTIRSEMTSRAAQHNTFDVGPHGAQP